jgi:hypothetical protein
MRATGLRLVSLSLAFVTLGACGGSAGSPSPTADPGPPEGAEFLLRVETEQAIPPLARFGWMPAIVITLDGLALTGGAVPAIFPGPLFGPIVQREITPAGWDKVVAAARAAGLLGGPIDLGGRQPGAEQTRLRIVADGRLHDVVGSNVAAPCLTEPCQGPPGTSAALQGFVGNVMDLSSLLGADVGPEARYVPAGYAIVVGPPPDDQGLAQPAMDWPFAAGFDAFGKPFADGSGFRCGTVVGEDAATLRPILEAATQITAFRDPVDGSLRGLTVRPILPGDGDLCRAFV